MELSKRLQAVADCVSEGQIVADIGTDHAYIPIHLVETGKSSYVIAMDINRGPLEKAEMHIKCYGMQQQIETRLSDGVCALKKGECDCVIIAGMGGTLAIRIMEDGKDIFSALKEFVLQPQSELEKVRRYLVENHYRIIQENMVYEDGKYYPMMKVRNQESEEYKDIELRYGKLLMKERHPVLKQFLEKELGTKEKIWNHLQAESSVSAKSRIEELTREIEEIKEALCVFL